MLARVFARRPLSPGSLRLCAMVLLAVLSFAGMCSSAVAANSVEGGTAFNELSQKAQEQEKTTSTEATTTSAAAKEPRNSKKTILIGIGAAIVLLLAIAYVIIRDARAHVPEEDPADLEATVHHDNAIRLRKQRAKAKAARQQRKRNR